MDFDLPPDAEAMRHATREAVDALLKDGASQFYVEIVSKPGHRAARAGSPTDDDSHQDGGLGDDAE